MPPKYHKKGKTKEERRQKAVDVQLGVDMVVGAYNGLFQDALLITGDADFIPAVQETRRRGVNVLLATDTRSASKELRKEVDVTLFLDEPWPWLIGNLQPRLHPLTFVRPEPPNQT